MDKATLKMLLAMLGQMKINPEAIKEGAPHYATLLKFFATVAKQNPEAVVPLAKAMMYFSRRK